LQHTGIMLKNTWQHLEISVETCCNMWLNTFGGSIRYDLFGGAGDRCYCELPPSATIIEIIKKEEGGKGTLWTAFDQRGHDWKFRLSGGSLDSGSATYTIHFLLPSTIHLFC